MAQGTGQGTVAPPSLRERQRAERESLILLEAEHLLSAEGYEGLVMERLADRVGISKGTIYQHFATKEALFGAIMLRSYERMGEQLNAQRAETGRTVAEQVGAVLTALCEERSSWIATLTGPQRQALANALADNPGLREAQARFFDGLRELVELGQQRGEFDPAFPAGIAAQFMLSLAAAQGAPSLRGDNAVPPDGFAAVAVRFFLQGISRPA